MARGKKHNPEQVVDLLQHLEGRGKGNHLMMLLLQDDKWERGNAKSDLMEFCEKRSFNCYARLLSAAGRI
jgi:hypothetical protein